jgi:hypothetical protein
MNRKRNNKHNNSGYFVQIDGLQVIIIVVV